MNDEQLQKVLQNVVKFLKNTPMGLQNFKKLKAFENALARITDSVKLTGGGGTVTATYLLAREQQEQLRKHVGRFSGIDLLKVGKEDAAQAVVVAKASDFHRIIGYFDAEWTPVVLRLLLEKFVHKSRKCHAVLTVFLLVFFAVLFSEDKDDFKRLMAEIWSIGSVRELLTEGYKWSNLTKYLETATIDIPEYEGELPPGWEDDILAGLGASPRKAPEGIEEMADFEMAADLEDIQEMADVEMEANLEDSGVGEAEEAHVAEDAIMEKAVAEAGIKDEPVEDEFHDALDSPLDGNFDFKGYFRDEYAAGDRAGPSNVPFVSSFFNNPLGFLRSVPVKEDDDEEKKVPRARHDFSKRAVSGLVAPMQCSEATSCVPTKVRPRKRPPKKKDLVPSSEPSAKSPRIDFDGCSHVVAQSTSTTVQVQPAETGKVRRHKVLEGQLKDKRLTDVNGVDKRAAACLNNKEWNVEALFGQFLLLKKDRDAFLAFIAAEVPLSPEDASRCYECLRDYDASHV